MSHPRTQTESMVRRASGLIAVLAGVVFWAPYLFTGTGPILTTGPLLGAAIVFLIGVNLYRVGGGAAPMLSVAVVVTVLAAVAAASPFLFDVSQDRVVQVTAVAGALAALLSAYTIVGSWQLRDHSAGQSA